MAPCDLPGTLRIKFVLQRDDANRTDEMKTDLVMGLFINREDVMGSGNRVNVD